MSAKRRANIQSAAHARQAGRVPTLPAGDAGPIPRPGKTRLGQNLATFVLASIFLTAPALGQTPGEAASDLATGLGYQPTTPPAADFVERARPDVERLGYQPLRAADRANHRKSAKELNAIANSLEGAKAGNRQRAARVTTVDQPAAPSPSSKRKGKRPASER